MGNQPSVDGKKGRANKNRRENNNQGSVLGKLKLFQPPFSKFVLVPCTATARKSVENGAGSEAVAGIRLRIGDNIVGTGGDSLGLGIPVDAKVKPDAATIVQL